MIFAVTQSLYAEVQNIKIYVLMTQQEQKRMRENVWRSFDIDL
jgi:hypothetical protein